MSQSSKEDFESLDELANNEGVEEFEDDFGDLEDTDIDEYKIDDRDSDEDLLTSEVVDSGNEQEEIHSSSIDNDEAMPSEIDDEDTAPKEKSWIQKNLVLVAIMGLVPVLGGLLFWLTTPPSNNTTQSVQLDAPNIQRSAFGNSQQTQPSEASVNMITTPVETAALTEPEAATIVQGITEDDVVDLIEPLANQVRRLSDSVNNINQYLAEKNESDVVKELSDENLMVIKDAINAGLDSTEAFLLGKLKEQNALIAKLSNRIQQLESRKAQVDLRRPLTMITATEGRARMKVTGTNEEFVVTDGESLRGYGTIVKVGAWGCLYLQGGETYEPDNAVCEG